MAHKKMLDLSAVKTGKPRLIFPDGSEVLFRALTRAEGISLKQALVELSNMAVEEPVEGDPVERAMAGWDDADDSAGADIGDLDVADNSDLFMTCWDMLVELLDDPDDEAVLALLPASQVPTVLVWIASAESAVYRVNIPADVPFKWTDGEVYQVRIIRARALLDLLDSGADVDDDEVFAAQVDGLEVADLHSLLHAERQILTRYVAEAWQEQQGNSRPRSRRTRGRRTRG